jgi:hypothetical protein
MIWWYAGPITIGILAILILFACVMFGSGNEDTAMLGIVVCIGLLGVSLVTIVKIHSDIKTEIYPDSDYNTAEMLSDLEEQKVNVGKHKIYQDEISYLKKSTYKNQVKWSYYGAVVPTPTPVVPNEYIHPNDYARN